MQHRQRRHDAFAWLHHAHPPEERAAREEGLRAQRTPAFALGVVVRVAVVLEAQATLPASPVSREVQTTPRAVYAEAARAAVPADGGARHAS